MVNGETDGNQRVLANQEAGQALVLAQQTQALFQIMQAHAAFIQETRDIVESLGRLQGVEWSQDLKQWVSKQKLAALKDSPLD